MSAILTSNFGVLSAKVFKDSVSRVTPSPEYLYLFYGKNTPWGTPDTPPAANNSVTMKTQTRQDMLALKRVYDNNISFVVPRINWTSGTIYTPYNVNDGDLLNKNFYILTLENNVYRCISNNGGVPSTTRPIGTISSDITTADGYVWRYMYTLTATQTNDFLTTTYMPVPNDQNITNLIGASLLMIKQIFNGDEGGILPTDDIFRQVGLVLNPRLEDGSFVSSNVLDVRGDTVLNKNLGEIIYFDNRLPTPRGAEESETYRIVISF